MVIVFLLSSNSIEAGLLNSVISFDFFVCLKTLRKNIIEFCCNPNNKHNLNIRVQCWIPTLQYNIVHWITKCRLDVTDDTSRKVQCRTVRLVHCPRNSNYPSCSTTYRSRFVEERRAMHAAARISAVLQFFLQLVARAGWGGGGVQQ